MLRSGFARSCSLLTLALLTLVSSPPLLAQAPVPEDSARALRVARSEQARFEYIRRQSLPWTPPRGGGSCDERIGRFCLTYGTGESTWEPSPEPERVQLARERLIGYLDLAAAEFPGDEWIAGQRVRYLIESERHADAGVAARACHSPDRWWCLALEGYALHSAGDFARADSVYRLALDAMPEPERRRWTDLSLLLEGGEVRAYRRLSDAERAAFEERFWWMAKPLYLLPGNDARTEHLSRHVLDRLQNRASATENISWGSDLREILLRYGAPAGWERMRPSSFTRQTDGMITRYPRGSRSFLPSARFVADPEGLAAAQWELKERRARVSYAPAYTPAFSELAHQIAVFTRGDSVVVVAAFDVEPDTLFREVKQLETGFFLGRDTHSPPVAARKVVDGRTGRLTLASPPGPALLSLEVRAPAEKRAARARYGRMLTATPAHGLAISDVMLLEVADSLPASLDEAVAAARGSSRLRAGERFALFWELYGLSAREPFSVGIVLINENRGLLRRLGERLGMVREVHPVRVRWQEAAETDERILPRSLELEVPPVSAGRYRLELTVSLPGREPIITSREIEVVE